MKSSLIFTSLLVFVLSVSFAQSNSGPNVWVGTANGAATDWHHPANWSKGKVPSDLDQVLIPDLSNNGHIAYPVIRYDAEASMIQIHPLAQLTVLASATLYLSLPFEMAVNQLEQIDNQGLIELETEQDTPLVQNKRKFATLEKRRK